MNIVGLLIAGADVGHAGEGRAVQGQDSSAALGDGGVGVMAVPMLGGGSRAWQNLTHLSFFYSASLYRSGASLKLMTSKFGVSNSCFRGFALSLYNSPVPEVIEASGGRFTACLPSPKWLWKQDTLFSVSQWL